MVNELTGIVVPIVILLGLALFHRWYMSTVYGSPEDEDQYIDFWF